MAATLERQVKDERDSAARVEETAAIVASTSLPRIFDTHPLHTLVLNARLQIVYANEAFLRLTGRRELPAILGLRLGEALGCIHSMAAGCGNGEACCFCGAAKSLALAATRLDEIRASGSDLPVPDFERRSGTEECVISRVHDEGGEGSLELRLWTKGLEFGGQGLILLAAEDISAEKRREILERVFYHDIANTANGIRTILELLDSLGDEQPERYRFLLKSAADQLVEEIESQRALKAAESRDLEARFEIFEGRGVLESTLAVFAYKLEGKDIRLELSPVAPRVAVESDPILLRRVLVNMVKNAIEAAVRGEILLAGINIEEAPAGSGGRGSAVFWVRNSAVMPEVARRRVFHRSFSTKGRGRGIGTYSMRLLAESYLKGKVSFSSREGEGTVFELRIPLA